MSKNKKRLEQEQENACVGQEEIYVMLETEVVVRREGGLMEGRGRDGSCRRRAGEEEVCHTQGLEGSRCEWEGGEGGEEEVCHRGWKGEGANGKAERDRKGISRGLEY